MRTNIEIDNLLMAEAMQRTGLRTERQVIEEALRTLIRFRRQEDILGLGGHVAWEGSLDDMRLDEPTK